MSNQVPSKFPKARGDRVSNPSPKKERNASSPNKKSTCAKCGKDHLGEFLVGTGNCFGCGKSVHKVKDCPNLKVQDKVLVKINQVVLMVMLRRRIVFMLSSLEVSKRFLPMW